MMDAYIYEARNDGSVTKHLLHREERNFVHLLIDDGRGGIKASRRTRSTNESTFFMDEAEALDLALELSLKSARSHMDSSRAWAERVQQLQDRIEELKKERGLKDDDSGDNSAHGGEEEDESEVW